MFLLFEILVFLLLTIRVLGSLKIDVFVLTVLKISHKMFKMLHV